MAIVSYIMATVLILISPDYIYGTGEGKNLVKAEITHNNSGITLSSVEEETDNEAVIRVANNNPEKIFYQLAVKQTPIQAQQYLSNELLEYGMELIAKDDTGKDVEAGLLSVSNQADNEESNSSKALEQTKEKDKTKQTDEKKTEKKETDKKQVDEKEKLTAKNASTDKADGKKADSSSDKEKESTEKKYAIELSKEEIEILQRIVEAEATGEDIKGKILVANVVMNRVEDKNFPDTIKEVVFQKSGGTYQFSPIKDKRYWSVKVTKETITAVDRVMQGEDYSKGALYFSARKRAEQSSMRWFDRNLEYLFRYGGHEFFKNK